MPHDNSEGGIASARLRDTLADDPKASLEKELHRHTGLVDDPELSRVVSFIEASAQHADDLGLPDRIEDATLWQELVNPTATIRATQATDSATSSFLTGSNQETEDTWMRETMTLQSVIRPHGRIVTFAGGTDSGKTNVACLLVECTRLLYGSELEVATNIETLAEGTDAQFIDNYPDLEAWSKQSEAPKIFVGDEMSSHAKASSKDAHKVVDRMGPLCRMAAKRKLRVVSLGHRPTDLHPDIRKMPGMRFIECGRVENELGEAIRYVLTVYEKVDDDGFGVNEICSISNVPKTNLTYDPDEETGWNWG
jgi:hypothetical protein